MEWMPQTGKAEFQFTHPGRGATLITLQVVLATRFNSRTPGGVRLLRSVQLSD